MKTSLFTGAAVLALAAGTSAAFATSKGEVLTNYANIAEAKYEDSLITAKTLQAAVGALIDAPSAETLAAAKKAWLAARVPGWDAWLAAWLSGCLPAGLAAFFWHILVGKMLLPHGARDGFLAC